MNSKADEIKL